MAFFSVFALLDKENKYKKLTKDICRRRQKTLIQRIGIRFTGRSLRCCLLYGI